MKVQAFAVLVALVGCGKSDSKENAKPKEPPSISQDGTQKVPPGYETNFKFGSKDVKLEYTWVAISMINGRPAYTIHAQGAAGMGLFTMNAPIPDETPSFKSLAGGSTPAFAEGVHFGLTADMNMGNGADIKITAVTDDSMSGTFTTQACPQGQPRCERPTNVTGSFKAYRSALSDDAMFERIYVRKGQ